MRQRLKPPLPHKGAAGVRQRAGAGSPKARPRPVAGLPEKVWVIFVSVFLVVAVWIVFGQTTRHEFVNFDDDIYVHENPMVARGLQIQGIVQAFTGVHGSNWHPFTTLSHLLDSEAFGLQAAGHHRTNVLLHAATAVALFLILRNLTGDLWRSAFVAAVFALHPLRVESVAWVAERKDVLSGLFFMLTLGAYARYTRRQFSAGRYLTVLVLFALGLLSKPMLVTLPFVLLLLDFWPLGRFRLPPDGNASAVGRLLLEKVPFVALAAASCVVTVMVQRQAIGLAQRFDMPDRLGNAVVAYVVYLIQLFWPFNLTVLYPHPAGHLPSWMVGASALLLAAISILMWLARRRRPYLLVGWLWFLGMLVPVIGLVQVGNQAHADRYTYLPQIGICLLLTWLAANLFAASRGGLTALRASAVVTIAALMMLAHEQTRHWRDSVSLWSHALVISPTNSTAHYHLGRALGARGRLGEAAEQYEQALRLDPNYDEARLNLGVIQYTQGKLAESIRQYELVLQRRPEFAVAHFDCGISLAAQGKLQEAATRFERAVQLKPDYVEALINLGNALGKLGKIQKAISQFRRAIEIQPENTLAYCGLGSAFSELGQMPEALQAFQQAEKFATADAQLELVGRIRAQIGLLRPARAENRP